jgi:hypothetical protein
VQARVSDFGGELGRLMTARGLGVRELARQVPCNPGHVSSLRSGGRRASPELADRLDELLGAGGRLGRLARGAAGPGASFRSVLDELAFQAVDIGQWAEMTNVGDGTIGQLDESIRQIACDYLDSPPEPVIGRAAEVSRRVFGLLRDHQRLRHARDLHVIGAKACAFLSWAAGDLGQFPAASAQGRAALILADEAGHPGARALALCALSKTAFWQGHRDRARDLARRGWECAPASSTRVLLACQEADATDGPDAREALDRAGRARDEISTPDELGGVFGCGPVRLANYAMGVCLRAGDLGAVLEAAGRLDGDAGAEAVGYGTWGQIRIGAGLAHLGAGELDGAASQFAPVLALPPARRLATLTSRLAGVPPVLGQAPYARSRAAAELSDQIITYQHDTAAVTALALPEPQDNPA